MQRFAFEFSRPLSWPLALLGVTPWTAHVDVRDDELAVRFGPWSLVTPLSNVEAAEVTGPYLPFKVLGPHISLADRGATFGTTWRRGACVRFRRPVAAALPGGLLTHPALTVTVADPELLVALLEGTARAVPADDDSARTAPDVAVAPPTPVATPPARRTLRPTTRTGPAGRRRARPGEPEHPTPADMPGHTPTVKVPGVEPPADEGLPGPDSAG